MAVTQFPFCYCPIGDIKKFAKILTVHTCHFPQFFYFGFAVHRVISINKKHTLRNYYSIGQIITQRVNYDFYAASAKELICFVSGCFCKETGAVVWCCSKTCFPYFSINFVITSMQRSNAALYFGSS